MTSMFTGANSILLHGGVSSELAYHPLLSIIDDDLAAIVGKTAEGFIVNDESMAMELIKEVGPMPGTFMNKAHTRTFWRRENYVPKTFDLLTHAEWMNSGKKSALVYARECREEILANHKIIPLADQQEEDVQRILNDARTYYQKRGML